MNDQQISAFASFLEWGAIGLAGLMLVLVIFAILSRNITAARKSLLQTFRTL